MRRFIVTLSLIATMIAFMIAFSGAASARNIIETMRDSSSFRQFMKAVDVAGLGPALSAEGPFTIFVPTDEAFSKIPKAALNDLLQPHNKEKLTKFLRHHVLKGLVVSRDFLGRRLEAIPLDGEALLLDARTQQKIGGAKILRTDMLATNGVIHIIDAVLIPSFDDMQQ